MRAATIRRQAARAKKSGRGAGRGKFKYFLEAATLLCRIYGRLEWKYRM